MKAFILTLLAAALAAQAGPARAERAVPLELATFTAQAMAGNAELQALQHDVAAIQARRMQAGVAPNPTLDYLREGERGQGGSTSVQLAIPLELGGKKGARVDAASAELAAAEVELGAVRMRIEAETIAAFHDAYLAQQKCDLANQARELAAQATRSVGRRVSAGKISPVEETRARVAEANLQIDMINASRDLTSARLKLALLAGAPLSASATLAPPGAALPFAPTAQTIAERVATAPQMRRAGAELAWRNAAARVERANRVPTVSLILGSKREGLGRERQNVLGLSLPLPFRDRNQGALREAEVLADKASSALAATRQRLLTEALQASVRLDAALLQERVVREEVLPGAQAAYEATRKGFEAGKFSFLELLDAQRSHVQAQALHLRAVSEAHHAAADLAALIGPGAPHNTTPSIQDPT
ncbi:MAG TPA: TolC family protein [Telluria sp.]|jgi:cobalt-zinc-cadmium efflux system outer membrane protein